jgi:CRISPR-associated endonuclease/helicase Cas3
MPPPTINFSAFFQEAMPSLSSQRPEPYPWQEALAHGPLPAILDVPTGLGKTEGIVLGWAYRRLILADQTEPRHLVYCLPMRVGRLRGRAGDEPTYP